MSQPSRLIRHLRSLTSAVWMKVRAARCQMMKPKPSFSFSTTQDTFWKIITGEQDACKQQQCTTHRVVQPRVRTL
eukprot:scaffold5576_cov131-Skeletonema_dohrnii-CCMP3373.AAC.7